MPIIELNLKALLKAKDLSIGELAEISGLNRRTIEAMVAGKKDRIAFSTMAALCAALDVEPGDLFVKLPAHDVIQEVMESQG